MSEKLIIFSSPSGAGKTTIVKHLLGIFPELTFSISATTRSIRKGETEGKDYHFFNTNRFKDLVQENAFVEWEEVYPGLMYGTLKSEVTRIWEEKKIAIFDVDVVGALNIKKQYGEKALTVFIQPPSIEALEVRLKSRGTDDEHSLQTRLEKADLELSFAPKFDCVIVNDDLNIAKTEAEGKIGEFINS
ncbi:MAG: guanylate kinase [Sphingobacteriales bacterium]|jgi:guanylate kinase